MDSCTRRHQNEANTDEDKLWKTTPTRLRITDDNVPCLAMLHMSKGIVARIKMRLLLQSRAFGTTFGVDRLLLENEVSAVLVSLQPATSYGAYLRRGGTIDINAAGMGDDEACRYAQETSHDNCPTGQHYKKTVRLVHQTTNDPH